MRAVEHQPPIARIQSEARHGDQTGARQNRFGIAQLPIRATAILQQPVHDRGFEKLKRVLRLRGRGQSTGNQIGLGLKALAIGIGQKLAAFLKGQKTADQHQ